MKKIYILVCFVFFILNSTFGQGGTWTWISGDSLYNATGTYGTQGVPDVNNHPPAEYELIEWKDKQGNFWVYGGALPSSYSDLWKYNPVSNEWTWVMGNGLPWQPAVYGTQGVPNPSNTPGQRSYCLATWVDTSGNLWLFGGVRDATEYLNDLWKYDISSNQWTWMGGPAVNNAPGVYGTQGVPSTLNIPVGRQETCSAWRDALNNLWLFGGGANGANLSLNDLWKYDIGTNEWTWMKGSDTVNTPANYGIKGVPDVNNDPGARYTYTKWKDANGNFWLMGGELNYETLNDIWKYDVSINEWTWMSGPNLGDDSGHYQSKCVFDTINMPNSRYEQKASITDNCGNFWLFSGLSRGPGYSGYNDLWVFDPLQLKWNWISGTHSGNQQGSYGTMGVPSPSNMPLSRAGAIAWWGNDNRFYMFGGTSTINFGLEYSDVWVFTPDTNCVRVCGAVVFPPPVADFQSSQASICTNDCINFTDLSTNASSWQWSFAGAIDSTSAAQNPQNVCYPAAGIYNVTLIVSNGGGRDSVTFSNYINVKAAPPTPVITQIGTTLYCSTDTSYSSYQWYLDTTLINGATDTSLVITAGGNYNVQVSNANGCKIAVGINIVLGIQNYTNDNMLSLSPNPTLNELLISGKWEPETGEKILAIFNMLGQGIYTEKINNAQITISCKSFPSGIYFLRIATESGQWTGKFVKE